MDFRIKLTPELTRLLSARDVPRGIRGEVTSNLEYMLALEYGHSSQAPSGWVRRNRDAYARLLRGEIEYALRIYPNDPIRAIYGGMALGTMGITRQVVDGVPTDVGTPVDTGRAKGSWVARVPGTNQRYRPAPEVTAAQQRAIIRRRREGQ